MAMGTDITMLMLIRLQKMETKVNLIHSNQIYPKK